MSDLISRQAAIEVCEKYNGQGYIWTCILNDIRKIPSAQPVIRCKDCKHFGGGTYCYERDGMWDENDFCSYAERKEQDDG